MELKKEKLYATLLVLDSQRKSGEEVIIQGILNEKITLGLKRRGQKILKAVATHYQEYENDLKECGENESEINELNNEVVKLDCEPLSLQMIEAIETENNYNWDLIEKLCK
jgi:hypothetical protein